MKINASKTKTMVIAKTKIKAEISINGCRIEQVNYFCYIGQTITDDAKRQTEKMRGIGMARNAFYEEKKQIPPSKKINVTLRKTI